MCPLLAPDNRWHKCHLYVEQKHTRAKPMSESASALFSIADAGEFRFARFYIVCEEVALAPLESPPIVCGLSDTPCGLSKRGKDTELDAGRGMEETLEFCFKEFAAAGYILELHTMHCPN